MSDEEENDDLFKFLAKVDQIEELVKDLTTSSDHTSSAKALEKADKYIKQASTDNDTTKSSTDRMLVNNNPTKPSSCQEGGVSNEASQSSFLSSLEEDAKERGERRREQERRGREAKRNGNKAFKESDYEGALGYFTAAITEMPWDTTLYTNRASTYNKMARYSEAIGDCDRALQFEPNTLKAYVHKGNALKGLKDFEAAKGCFSDALELFPEHHRQLRPDLKGNPPIDCPTVP